ncbi:6-hydroxymethylpterin diphosphokinase MptE-like protein [Clostridium thermarum]|uniref:6-hydroxymethylpterin diphosphokinase MptE-like protein n=1 Tax=Clostridium thermarum TaxID=1716543 RepID=UPI0013D1CAF8|nr:6-hydroxymethylpterin diphosphokinase MptE-like protein [Clostridium thermarum]
MNIEIRKIIYKYRFIHKMAIRIVDFNNKLFYRNFNKKYHHDKRIEKLKNTQKGKRCFIVGNGPSLTISDLELLKNEDCFASNLIFKLFDKTTWRPTYYFIQDRYADTGDNLDKMNVKYMFIGDYYWRKRGINNPKALCIHTARNFDKNNVCFSTDIAKQIISHHTITYTMIQAAVYMGYREIYLLGMDHSYTLTYDSKGKIIENKEIISHVFEDKNPKEVIANIEGMNQAYIAARNFAEKNNIKIYNVTRGGKLEWFPRISLEEALK